VEAKDPKALASLGGKRTLSELELFKGVNMKNKTYLVLIVLIISAFILLASCQNQKAEWKGTIEEVDGVTVVKNPKEPMYSEDVFSLEEELAIEEAEGREEYMFSRLSGIAVDKEKRIYVLDSKEGHIKIFDKNGDYVKAIGKKGQGPGEMSLSFSICITSQNEIMVQDLNNHRIMFFSLDGTLIKSLSTAKIIIVGSTVDSKGNIIGIVSIRGPERQIIELKKFDSNLNYLFSFGSSSLPSSSPTFNPFKPELCWAVGKEDNVICGYPDVYEFELFDSEGKVMMKVVKDFKPVRITQEEIEETKKRLPGPMRLDIPQYHSAYQDLTVDEESRIFVQTWEKAKGGEGYYYDVFDSDGRYIAKIPLRMRPEVWKNDKLYTIEEDADGYQVIKRYKVTWKYQQI